MSTAFVLSLAIAITKSTSDGIQSLTQQIILDVCSRDEGLLTFVQDVDLQSMHSESMHKYIPKSMIR